MRLGRFDHNGTAGIHTARALLLQCLRLPWPPARPRLRPPAPQTGAAAPPASRLGTCERRHVDGVYLLTGHFSHRWRLLDLRTRRLQANQSYSPGKLNSLLLKARYRVCTLDVTESGTNNGMRGMQVTLGKHRERIALGAQQRLGARHSVLAHAHRRCGRFQSRLTPLRGLLRSRGLRAARPMTISDAVCHTHLPALHHSAYLIGLIYQSFLTLFTDTSILDRQSSASPAFSRP